jgi:O-antigen ligase
MNNFKISKIYTNKFNYIFLIPFLIWGPFFPDLIVSFSALFFLYYVIKNKDYNFFLIHL